MEFSFQQIVMNVDIKPGEKGEGSISSKNVRRRERKEIVETKQSRSFTSYPLPNYSAP